MSIAGEGVYSQTINVSFTFDEDKIDMTLECIFPNRNDSVAVLWFKGSSRAVYNCIVEADFPYITVGTCDGPHHVISIKNVQKSLVDDIWRCQYKAENMPKTVRAPGK